MNAIYRYIKYLMTDILFWEGKNEIHIAAHSLKYSLTPIVNTLIEQKFYKRFTPLPFLRLI